MRKDIPFYQNTSDNTHCFQASLRMILKHFLPEREFSWKDLEQMTEKKQDLWTWQLAGILWMQANGFEVRNKEIFDYEEFIQHGEKYLLEEFGKEVGNAQIKYSDIDQERHLSEIFVRLVQTEKSVPTTRDIKELLQKGFLMIINLNSNILNKKSGYDGHSVVITSIEDSFIFLHDPGLPPKPNRKVALNAFEKAWAYPNEKAKSLIAFRLKKSVKIPNRPGT